MPSQPGGDKVLTPRYCDTAALHDRPLFATLRTLKNKQKKNSTFSHFPIVSGTLLLLRCHCYPPVPLCCKTRPASCQTIAGPHSLVYLFILALIILSLFCLLNVYSPPFSSHHDPAQIIFSLSII